MSDSGHELIAAGQRALAVAAKKRIAAASDDRKSLKLSWIECRALTGDWIQQAAGDAAGWVGQAKKEVE